MKRTRWSGPGKAWCPRTAFDPAPLSRLSTGSRRGRACTRPSPAEWSERRIARRRESSPPRERGASFLQEVLERPDIDTEILSYGIRDTGSIRMRTDQRQSLRGESGRLWLSAFGGYAEK